MHFLKSKKKNYIHLYNKIAFLTRKIFFYEKYKLKDSFSNRIYLVFFHLSFILTSQKMKKVNKNISQDIFDSFFKQLEFNCREIGYSDTAINKKMKELLKLFYEISIYCIDWKQLHSDKKNYILMKFFEASTNNKIFIDKLTIYFDEFSSFVDDIPLKSLIKGVFNFDYKE